MRILKYNISVVSGLILLASCQEELVYDPFETSDNGMQRYLAKVYEVTYINSGLSQTESTNELFGNPNFDNNGKLLNAYVNFIGRQVNNTYAYGDNKIIVTSLSRDNKRYLLEYTLDNGLIKNCEESAIGKNEKYYYSYDYNSDGFLKTINVNKDDFSCIITLNWHNRNMMSVKVLYENGSSSIYSYEYTHNEYYNPKFPPFWISCFEIGGVYGVDEILSCQGYFGKSISNDLISKEYYGGNLSREFEYKLDEEGYIILVSAGVNKKYKLEWR